MGLDTTHNCWHGPYSSFCRWREEIAKLAGYAVWKVSYDDGMILPCIMLDWGHITDENLMGEWDYTPTDPLLFLFAHSDCEGVIHPKQAKLLYESLETLMISKENIDLYTSEKTYNFIEGLKLAVKKNEDIEFH